MISLDGASAAWAKERGAHTIAAASKRPLILDIACCITIWVTSFRIITRAAGIMSEKNEEKLKFSAETGKVLQLMIHSLYTNRDIFLRELISNASDACDKLRYEAITRPELTQGDSEFKINILVN